MGEAEKIRPYRVLLNGGEQVTYARTNGEFIFRDVAPGRYVVDVSSVDELFPQFKVDVAVDGVIRAIEYQYPGTANACLPVCLPVFYTQLMCMSPTRAGAPKARAEYPLAVEPVAELDYFEEREKFSLMQFIMNPSFLTIVLPIGLLYLLPKLSEAMMGMCTVASCLRGATNLTPRMMQTPKSSRRPRKSLAPKIHRKSFRVCLVAPKQRQTTVTVTRLIQTSVHRDPNRAHCIRSGRLHNMIYDRNTCDLPLIPYSTRVALQINMVQLGFHRFVSTFAVVTWCAERLLPWALSISVTLVAAAPQSFSCLPLPIVSMSSSMSLSDP
jgi:hypothetical protein